MARAEAFQNGNGDPPIQALFVRSVRRMKVGAKMAGEPSGRRECDEGGASEVIPVTLARRGIACRAATDTGIPIRSGF